MGHSSRVATILRQGFSEFRDFVNPLIAQRTLLLGEPWQVVRAKDGCLLDASGKRIEDFHGTQAFGHRHPAVTKAVEEFLASDSPNWFPSRQNPYAGRLALSLCERAAKRGKKGELSFVYDQAFFAGSGSEAVEAALKLSRAVTKKPRIFSLEGAYHGCTFGSCALMSDGPYRDPFAPHLPGVQRLPFGDVEALHRAFAQGDVAAVVVEPIQVEGGVRPLPLPYLSALCTLTEEHGALLVADEVQTGLGRTGRFLCSETWPRRPDAVLLGKHLGGGLMPVSAMLYKRDLFTRAYGADFEASEAHNSTFSGNALACVAALSALDLLSLEQVARVGELGEFFRQELKEALSELPLFEEIRGEGLCVGIALRDVDHPWLSFEHFGVQELKEHPTVGLLYCHRLYKRGFFCFVCGHDWRVLRIQPRFTIEKETLSSFVKAAREELSYLCDLL